MASAFSKVRLVECHKYCFLSLLSCIEEESRFVVILKHPFLVVRIHYDKAASRFIVLVTEPVFYKGHQLLSYMARCALIFPVYPQSSYQYSRVATPTFWVYDITLQTILSLEEINLVLMLSLAKVNNATIRCGNSVVTQQ